MTVFKGNTQPGVQDQEIMQHVSSALKALQISSKQFVINAYNVINPSLSFKVDYFLIDDNSVTVLVFVRIEMQ